MNYNNRYPDPHHAVITITMAVVFILASPPTWTSRYLFTGGVNIHYLDCHTKSFRGRCIEYLTWHQFCATYLIIPGSFGGPNRPCPCPSSPSSNTSR